MSAIFKRRVYDIAAITNKTIKVQDDKKNEKNVTSINELEVLITIQN